MKASRLLTGVAAVVLLTTSCHNKDSRILTVVNEDGTCVREISFHASPQGLMAKADERITENCLHFGSDWERTWSVVGEDSVRHPVPITQEQWDSIQRVYPKQYVTNKILLHAKREFQSVGEMSDSLSKVVGALFKATGTLEKHFKWFYTDYVYKETFACTDLSQYFPVPIDRFVSADTASYWFTGQPDLTRNMSGAEQKEMLDGIEAQVSQWLSANAFEYVYRKIGVMWYDEVKNPPVSKERFMELKDSIVMTPAVRNMDILNTGEQVSDILRDFYHSDAYTPLLQDSARISRALEHQYNGYGLLTTINFQYDLVMPGKVSDSGEGASTYRTDGHAEGNVVHHRFTGERLIPHDYTISATSRVTNIWAYVVTLLVILIAIGSFVFKTKS